MADDSDTPEIQTVNCTILEGPDGALYCISDENLKAHRIDDDFAPVLREAYRKRRAQTEPAHGADAETARAASSFQILGQGPVVRRTGLTVSTLDTWFDIYA